MAATSWVKTAKDASPSATHSMHASAGGTTMARVRITSRRTVATRRMEGPLSAPAGASDSAQPSPSSPSLGGQETGLLELLDRHLGDVPRNIARLLGVERPAGRRPDEGLGRHRVHVHLDPHDGGR